MRHALRRVALLVAAVGMCCCATPPEPVVISTTSIRVAEQPRKVFVLAHFDQSLPDAFEDGYVAALEQQIENLGSQVRAVKLTGLELDRRAHENARAAFGPDMVLIVGFNTQSTYGSTHRGVVGMQLLDARDIVLWRAQQGFAFSFLSVASKSAFEFGERAGGAAIQKLVADRVFPGTI